MLAFAALMPSIRLLEFGTVGGDPGLKTAPMVPATAWMSSINQALVPPDVSSTYRKGHLVHAHNMRHRESVDSHNLATEVAFTGH